MKLSSIFVVIIYAFLEFDRASSFDSLLVLKIPGSSDGIKLPYKAIESDEKIITYPEIDKNEKNYMYLCAVPSETDPKIAFFESQFYSENDYCLMENNSSRCLYKARPFFTNKENSNAGSKDCGTSSNHSLYHFGFNYCTDAKNPLEDRRLVDVQLIRIYDICFDAQKARPVWTKHQIRTGFMLKGPEFSSQHLENDSEFSTDGFGNINNFDFESQAKKYDRQKSDSDHLMIPQRFVPHEDFALRLWKKTTSHYANTDSLWIKLAPLMQAINHGIRKAAIKVNTETARENIYNGHNLDIYTTTYPYESFWKRMKRGFKNALRLRFRKSPFGWNIWCKFVHYQIENQGILIFLHNLPDNPPVEINPAVDNSKVEQSGQETKKVEGDDLSDSSQTETETASSVKSNKKDKFEEDEFLIKKECEETVKCEFEKWFAQEPQPDLPPNFLDYAYCCKATKDNVKELFGGGVEVKHDIGLLDINDMILAKNKG